MKAAAFELRWPASVAEAEAAGGRFMAGGQSLGPMMNLRVARPALVVPLGRLPALQGVEAGPAYLTVGAGVTHAQIADGGLGAGRTARIMARVAAGIAYRAVRTRGTIGGSLCHADPSADWLCTLSALGASVITSRGRAVALPGFCTGAYQVALEPGELVQAARVPQLSAAARWGYVKFCRKPGEFAHAMAAVMYDGEVRRAAIGALGGPPRLLQGGALDEPWPTNDLVAEVFAQAKNAAKCSV